MKFEHGSVPSEDELVDLYGAVGWTSYTADPAALSRAVRNSSHLVTVRDDGLLVGLARVLTDDVSILYVQDVLVRPSHQRRRVGWRLLDEVFSRYAHVRQRVLLTDDEPHQHRLYRAAGLHDVGRLANARLHAFVDIAGAGLKSTDEAVGGEERHA